MNTVTYFFGYCLHDRMGVAAGHSLLVNPSIPTQSNDPKYILVRKLCGSSSGLSKLASKITQLQVHWNGRHFKIDLSNLEEGIYFINVMDGANLVQSAKVVKVQ